ncbi:MAG: exported protein of unknown function [Nitrospira sp.]|jgi:hypothetical protein|nr:exported protein of unknown function [Nitrospira sp.]
MNGNVIVVALGLLSLAHWVPSWSSAGFAQTEIAVPFATAGFQSGVIDEAQGSTIRIDGRSYVLKSDVAVVNHEGEPLALDRIIPTSLVRFHLKEGRIDKMVVKLPQ